MTSLATPPSPNPIIGFPWIVPQSLTTSQSSLHQYSHSTSSLTTNATSIRKSLTTLARDRVVGIANIGTNSAASSLRSTTSSGSLHRQASFSANDRLLLTQSNTGPTDSAVRQGGNGRLTGPAGRTMAVSERNNSKMHQTSSKVLRATDDDRPFTKDFMDLFSTLITSLPLTPHRVRFSKMEETFSSEEAITNLGSLKFSQSNRIPDPKNPSRWVVTTTTTTFTMAREMARQVCQRFVDARFIESAEGKIYSQFPIKGAVWQLTPKGCQILRRFCDKNGIEARHIESLIRRARMQMVVLERDLQTDRLIQDKTTIEVVFRRMCGVEGPNLKATTAQADSDSLSEYASGTVGVKMAKDRKVGGKSIPYTFSGRAASDWLLDCCTTVDRRETFELCKLFMVWQLISPVTEDRDYSKSPPPSPTSTAFQPTKYAIYTVTEKGQRVCGWIARPSSVSSEDSADTIRERTRIPKDTNTNRFSTVVGDPALRMLFREHLRTSLCEENLNFYLDVQEFLSIYRAHEKADRLDTPEVVRDCLATAYGLQPPSVWRDTFANISQACTIPSWLLALLPSLISTIRYDTS